MNILHIIYKLDTGGLENGLINLINHLPRHQYQHTILSLTTASEFKKRIQNKNVTIICLNKDPGPLHLYYRKIWKIIRQINPDIVHTRNLSAIECQIVAAFSKIRYRIHSEHGRDIGDIQGTNRKNIVLRRLMKPFIHHFIALSYDIKKYLMNKIKIPEDQISLIYNGVDTHKFKPMYGGPNLAKHVRSNVSFVSIGRIQKVKNFPMLISAAKILLDKLKDKNIKSNFSVHIIGDGPELLHCKNLASHFGVVEFIKFYGHQENISEILNELDVFILPSLVEGISNTILEAKSCGLPVIATDVGGNSEIINLHDEQDGILVPSSNPKVLADAMLQFIENSELINQMGKNARISAINHFSLEAMVNKYHKVYAKEISLCVE